MTLPEKLLALHEALDKKSIPHAFGGAIALAYRTLVPRGTIDIDINVFVPAEQAQQVLDALPRGVTRKTDAARLLKRDAQIRLWWDQTPVDLFLDSLPIHVQAAENVEIVPFEGERIPVLGATELAVFKAMFGRTQDWADIEAMLAARTLDLDAVKRSLGELIGDTDDRFERLDAAVSAAEKQ